MTIEDVIAANTSAIEKLTEAITKLLSNTITKEELKKADMVEVKKADRQKETVKDHSEIENKEPTLADLRDALLKINAKISKQKSLDLLAKFGATSLVDTATGKKGIAPEDIPKCFELATKVLSGEGYE
jgi:hypothetical protein